MSVKTTQELTRQEAEQKYVELRKDFIERELRAEAVLMDNEELENIIETMDNKLCGGESFRNYSIVGEY